MVYQRAQAYLAAARRLRARSFPFESRGGARATGPRLRLAVRRTASAAARRLLQRRLAKIHGVVDVGAEGSESRGRFVVNDADTAAAFPKFGHSDVALERELAFLSSAAAQGINVAAVMPPAPPEPLPPDRARPDDDGEAPPACLFGGLFKFGELEEAFDDPIEPLDPSLEHLLF